jgi:hypothetical protein
MRRSTNMSSDGRTGFIKYSCRRSSSVPSKAKPVMTTVSSAQQDVLEQEPHVRMIFHEQNARPAPTLQDQALSKVTVMSHSALAQRTNER